MLLRHGQAARVGQRRFFAITFFRPLSRSCQSATRPNRPEKIRLRTYLLQQLGQLGDIRRDPPRYMPDVPQGAALLPRNSFVTESEIV